MSQERYFRTLLKEAIDYINCVSRQCGGEDGCVCGGEDLDAEIRRAVACKDGQDCAWANEWKVHCTCEPPGPSKKTAPTRLDIKDFKTVTKDEL